MRTSNHLRAPSTSSTTSTPSGPSTPDRKPATATNSSASPASRAGPLDANVPASTRARGASRTSRTNAPRINVPNILVGSTAIAAGAAAASTLQETSATALIPSPVATGLTPIPFGLPVDMAARLDQVLGTEPALPFDIMNRIIGPNGLLNSTKLAAEMARSSPETIFEAINQASWCGGNAPTIAESLRSCVRKGALDPGAPPPTIQTPTAPQPRAGTLRDL